MRNQERALCAASALAFVLAPAAFGQTPAAPQTEAARPAQTPAAPAPVAKDHGGLDVVVVTARRREEEVQSTPVTLTAFSGEALQEKGISDFSRLMQATPGVNFDTFPKSAPRPFFRGIGSSNQGAGSDPSSVAFLDGVYLGRAAMLGINFYNMERIEVLKGPPGPTGSRSISFSTDRRTSNGMRTARRSAPRSSQSCMASTWEW